MEQNRPDVQYEIMLVTPAIAAAWLVAANGRRQRTINPLAVAKYVSDMREGRWNFEGNPIRFDVDGILCDGQHRLTAIVVSQKSQWIGVLHNIKHEAFVSIDGGHQRTLKDVLTIQNFKNANNVAAIAGRVLIFAGGPITRGSVRQSQFRWSRGKMAEYVRSVEPEVSVVVQASRDARQILGMEPRVAGALFVLIRRKSKDDAETFIHDILNGVNLNEGHPALTLRNWLIRNRSDNSTTKVISDIYAFTTAWNAYRRKTPLKMIKIPAAVTKADEEGNYQAVPDLL